MRNKEISLEDRVHTLEERVSALEKRNGKVFENNEKQSKKISIKEFMIQYEAKNDVENTLVIASYLEQNKGLSNFNADDIKKGFKEARIPQPANTNDKINLNIKKGLIMDSDEYKDGKKAWMLTASSEKKLNELRKKTER